MMFVRRKTDTCRCMSGGKLCKMCKNTAIKTPGFIKASLCYLLKGKKGSNSSIFSGIVHNLGCVKNRQKSEDFCHALLIFCFCEYFNLTFNFAI